MSLNKSIVKGNLGKDPKIFSTNEIPNAYFQVAARDYYYNDQGEKQEVTDWINVKASGKAATFCESLSKGDLVFVDGKIRTETWKDESSGEFKSEQYLIAKHVEILKRNQKTEE